MALDPRKVNQKAPIFGDRRTKRGRDRSTRNRRAVADAMPYDVPTYDECSICGEAEDCAACLDPHYDPDVCGFCGDSIESCSEIRSRDDY